MLRALRKLQKEQDPQSAFVFVSERGAPFDRKGFNWRVKRTWPGSVSGVRMLRHAAGYTLANAGKDTRSIQVYLGHKDIRHTVRYTELSPTRFKTSSRTDGKRNPEAHPSPGLRAAAFRSNEVATIDQRSGQFASTRQRLKASGWRGIELGPVELFLNAVKSFFANLAPLAQALQCCALGGDRA